MYFSVNTSYKIQMEKRYIFYHHGGSGNHGCEAIVRSVVKILGKHVELISFRPEDDYKYGLDKVVSSIHKVKEIGKSGVMRGYLYVMRHFFRNKKPDYKYQFKDVVNSKEKVAISIGGDLYCGEDTESLTYINKLVSKENVSVLLGCSIEPEKLKDSKIVDDMRRYHLISARESITYSALINAGVKENVILCADPAFQLDTIELPLPSGFEKENTVGINVSPLVIMREKQNGILMKTYDNLIQYIIDNTNYQMALIPHVVWQKKGCVKRHQNTVTTTICGIVLSLNSSFIFFMTLFGREIRKTHRLELKPFQSYFFSFSEGDMEMLLQILVP